MQKQAYTGFPNTAVFVTLPQTQAIGKLMLLCQAAYEPETLFW